MFESILFRIFLDLSYRETANTYSVFPSGVINSAISEFKSPNPGYYFPCIFIIFSYFLCNSYGDRAIYENLLLLNMDVPLAAYTSPFLALNACPLSTLLVP
jgi:hypothetical protein